MSYHSMLRRPQVSFSSPTLRTFRFSVMFPNLVSPRSQASFDNHELINNHLNDILIVEKSGSSDLKLVIKRASRPPTMAPTPKTLHEKVKAILHKPWLNLSMARTVSTDYRNDLVSAIFVAKKLIPSFEEYSKQCDKELDQILKKRPTASLKTKIDVSNKSTEELQDGINSTPAPLPPPTPVNCEFRVAKRKKRVKVRLLGRVIGNLKRMHNALSPRLKSKLTRWNVEYCFVPMLKLPESELQKYVDITESECDRVSISSEFSPAPSMDQDEEAEVKKRMISNEESNDALEMDNHVNGTELSENESIRSSSRNEGSVISHEETEADNGTSNKEMTPHDSHKTIETDSNKITEKTSTSNNFAQRSELIGNEKMSLTNLLSDSCIEKSALTEDLEVDNESIFHEKNSRNLTNGSTGVNKMNKDKIGQEESMVTLKDPVEKNENQKNINGNVPFENRLCSSIENHSSNRKRRRSSSIEEDGKNRRVKTKKSSSERRSSSVGERKSASDEKMRSDSVKRRRSNSLEDRKEKYTKDKKNEDDFRILFHKESLNKTSSNDCDSYAASPASLEGLSGCKTPLKVEAPDDETDFFIPDFSDLDISPQKDPIELEESRQNYLARANRATVIPVLKTLKYP